MMRKVNEKDLYNYILKETLVLKIKQYIFITSGKC